MRAAVLSALFMPIVTVWARSPRRWCCGRADRTCSTLPPLLSVGTLAAFVQYATGIFEPISNIARIFADLQASQAAAERVVGMLETEPEIADAPEVVERFGDSFEPRRENWPDIRGDVEFDHVFVPLQHRRGSAPRLLAQGQGGADGRARGRDGQRQVDHRQPRLPLLRADAGRILIDGVDYRERSILWLQSHLGYVLQQPHLFSGTIRENIRFGRLDATDEDVERAARMVGAESFILGLEHGYDTQVGEGGGLLSTGQKQLISFARALVANPSIFILDEATSSVDTETEQRLQSAIAAALKGRTSFIIAHRLSTIRSADVILVIRDGRIIERGSHRELLRQRGYYYQLYVNQFREEQVRASWDQARA